MTPLSPMLKSATAMCWRSVLRTRSERSGDVMLVDMRSGETAWLGQPALLAARRRAGGYVWIVHADGLQLAAIDPGGVRGAGRS